MARIRPDGSLDKRGGFYMLCVLCSEAFVYGPVAYYAYMSNELAYLSCNHPFQLFFSAQFISAVVAMPLGIYSTEIIAAEDTYVRGLAELQAMRYHWLIRLHVTWEFAWLLHGGGSDVASAASLVLDICICLSLIPPTRPPPHHTLPSRRRLLRFTQGATFIG